MEKHEYTIGDLHEADENCAKASKIWASYVHEVEIVKSTIQDYLAALKMQIRKDFDVSESELETRARASQEWQKFRKETKEKLRQAGKAKIVYENAHRRWETVRSGLSTRKKEIERLGG